MFAIVGSPIAASPRTRDAPYVAQQQIRGLVLCVHRAQRQISDGSTTLRTPVHASHSISTRAYVHEVPEVGMYVPGATTVNDKTDAGEPRSEASRMGSCVSAMTRGKEHPGRRGGRT
eukprot:5355916-Pleurochrysis_carterae.AAC.2